MTTFLVAIAGLFAFIVTAVRGPKFCFNWVYFPVFLLVPLGIWIQVPALPDIDIRRAILLCMLVAALLSSRSELKAVESSRADKLIALVILSWGVSYAHQTDVMGFVHQLSSFGIDLWLPYYFVRRFWKTREDLSRAFLPALIATFVLSMLAVYEARMVNRGYAEFWGALAGTEVMHYFDMFRWGYLRAAVSFAHPITLGVTLATMTPLILLLGAVSTKWRRACAMVAAVAALGTLASISRGPIVGVLLAFVCIWLLYKKRGGIYVVLGLACAIGFPLAMSWLSEASQYVNAALDERGNVSSGYYRLALFMIYVDDIISGGLFGNPAQIGQDFAAAWSIDNSYIYIFLTYGWLGGFAFLLLAGVQLVMALRNVMRSDDTNRLFHAIIFASVFSITFSMLNVWFADDYAPLFVMLFGLVVNQSITPGPSMRKAGQDSEKIRRPIAY